MEVLPLLLKVGYLLKYIYSFIQGMFVKTQTFYINVVVTKTKLNWQPNNSADMLSVISIIFF